ncbi:hypothetical protein BJY01DRAFT_243043 [Aspergillus pseudoustus]|uniref:Uncharacterized protein n=1 Tax=Aspergillus pseudoustus TaxID=1810923 RepID=A0ABR4KUA7_9EURO
MSSSNTTTSTSAPATIWAGTPYKPSPYECPSCSLCMFGEDCPTAEHPFNTLQEKGLRCYECSACSHREYEAPETGIQVNAPKPYKEAHANLYTESINFYVHVPLDEVQVNSNTLKYRLALAEMQNSKGTIYTAEHEAAGEIPESGEIIAVCLKQHADPTIILEEARESVKRKLREEGVRKISDFEKYLGETN